MSPGSRPSHGAFPDRFPTTSRIAPRITNNSPNPRRIFPSSLISMDVALERELGLASGTDRQFLVQMEVRRRRRPATVGAPHDVADLQQEWLDHLDERLRFIIDGRRDGFQADRAAAVLLDDCHQEAAIEPVEPRHVHAFPVERVAGRGGRDHAVAPFLFLMIRPPPRSTLFPYPTPR